MLVLNTLSDDFLFSSVMKSRITKSRGKSGHPWVWHRHPWTESVVLSSCSMSTKALIRTGQTNTNIYDIMFYLKQQILLYTFIWGCWSHLLVFLPVLLLVLASVLRQSYWLNPADSTQSYYSTSDPGSQCWEYNLNSQVDATQVQLHFPLVCPFVPLFLTSWITLDKSIGRNHDFDVVPQDLALC